MSLLEASAIDLRIDGVRILEDVGLELERGEMVGLIGPNGAGKSSLLRLLAGVEASTRGDIFFAGKPLGDMPARSRAQRIGYLEQGAAANWPLRVEQIVELGRLPYQKWWLQPTADDRAKVEQAMRIVEGGAKNLSPRNVLEGSGDAAFHPHAARVDGVRVAKAGQRRPRRPDKEDRLDQVAARLLDGEGRKFAIMERTLVHHPVHRQTTLQ